MIVLFAKLIRRSLFSLREMIKETYHILFCQRKPYPIVSSEDKRFIEINNRYWHDNHFAKKPGLILVEGFFSQSGNNYVLRTGMLAKAIQSKTKQDIAVLFDKPAFKSILGMRKYASFGIKHFIYMRAGLSQGLSFLQASFFALFHYLLIKNPDDLLQIKHNGILFGDIIYDDIIKLESHKYTISKKEKTFLKIIFQAFFYYFIFSKIFKKNQVSFLVCTHLVYVQYGMLGRIALRYGADVVETNDLRLNHLEAHDYKNGLIAPTYHSVCKHYFKKHFQDVQKNSLFIKLAEENLRERLSGSTNQFDARLAYKNKIPLSRQQLQQKLFIKDEKKPIVVIFAHVFADAPHSCATMLFRDYYDWFNETIRHIVSIKEVNWLIKPHPSAKLYGELGLVESMVERVNQKTNQRNIFVFPEGSSASNLDEIADVIITVNGTAGIEFSCLGLPVILTGDAFYSGFGFTYDPATREAYFDLLKNINEISRLSEAAVLQAKALYGAYIQLKMLGSDIIRSDALDMIWGYGETNTPDVELGNKHINDMLMQHDPKNETQYLQLLQYLS